MSWKLSVGIWTWAVLVTDESKGVFSKAMRSLRFETATSMLDYAAQENRIVGMSFVKNSEADKAKLKKLNSLLLLINKVSSSQSQSENRFVLSLSFFILRQTAVDAQRRFAPWSFGHRLFCHTFCYCVR